MKTLVLETTSPFQGLPELVAYQEGLFEKEGLKIEWADRDEAGIQRADTSVTDVKKADPFVSHGLLLEQGKADMYNACEWGNYCRAGATAILVALGPGALPTLESAVLAGPSERQVSHLAPVLVAIGRELPLKERAALRVRLLRAASRARTTKSRATLEEVAGTLLEGQGIEQSPVAHVATPKEADIF